MILGKYKKCGNFICVTETSPSIAVIDDDQCRTSILVPFQCMASFCLMDPIKDTGEII